MWLILFGLGSYSHTISAVPYGNEREIKPGGENAETGKGTASITASLVAATAPAPSNALLLRRPVLFALCENKWSLGIVLKFYDFLSRVGEGRTWGGVGRQGRERRGVAPRSAHQERHFEGGRETTCYELRAAKCARQIAKLPS